MLREPKPHLSIHLILGLVMTALLGLTACNSSADVPEDVAENILSIVHWNLNYATDENLDGYMWTIHQDSPGYGQTRSVMQTAMSDFDLVYQLVDSEIISYSGDTAKVRVTQLTRSRQPTPAFRDNQLVAVHTLKLTQDGEWKIYTSSFSDIEYLEP